MPKSIIWTLALLVSVWYSEPKVAEQPPVCFEEPVEQVCTDAELLYTALVTGDPYRDICAVDSLTAAIVVAQARWETANFTSRLYLQHNNAFGMMHARKRRTTSLGALARAEGRAGYASYASPQDSALDLLLWLEFNEIIPAGNPIDYCKQLKSNKYFTDRLRHYATGVNTFYISWPITK